MEVKMPDAADAGGEEPGPDTAHRAGVRCGLAEACSRMTAWECVGCGRIEGPQPCIGVCQDRKVDFVYAADYDAALAELAAARRQADALAKIVRQLARTTPRDGRWEQCYRALQGRARGALASPGVGGQPPRR